MIFISYRRLDTGQIAGRICARLKESLGDRPVFIDYDCIPAGVEFRDYIRTSLENCEAVVVLIGPDWLGSTADGNTRISKTDDFIRMEVSLSLTLRLPIFPLLVDRALMPPASKLPDEVKQISHIGALVVDSGRDFDYHMRFVCESLQATLHRPAHRFRSNKERRLASVCLGFLLAIVASPVLFRDIDVGFILLTGALASSLIFCVLTLWLPPPIETDD